MTELKSSAGVTIRVPEESVGIYLSAGFKRPPDLSALNVGQLRRMAKERGLEADPKATKAQLIELLGE